MSERDKLMISVLHITFHLIIPHANNTLHAINMGAYVILSMHGCSVFANRSMMCYLRRYNYLNILVENDANPMRGL